MTTGKELGIATRAERDREVPPGDKQYALKALLPYLDLKGRRHAYTYTRIYAHTSSTHIQDKGKLRDDREKADEIHVLLLCDFRR